MTSADSPNPPVANDAKPRRPWTWKRRLRTAAIILVAGTLIFRALLSLLLPLAINRTAHALGYTVTYDRMQLSLLGTNAALWGVDIKTRDGTQQILKCEYAYANLSQARLFRLNLKAWRLEADDVALDVIRKPDGSIPLLQAFTSSAPPPKPAAGVIPKPIRFSLPIEVHAVRLHNLALHLRDESVSPAFEHTFRSDLRVSTVGRPGTPATLDLECTTDSLFDAMRATGEATTTDSTVESKLSFYLRGLRAANAAPYLQALGITVAERNTDIKGSAAVSLAAIPNFPGQVSGSIALTDLAVTSESETAASLAKADIQVAALSPSSLHISKVTIDKGVVRAERTQTGLLRFASFEFGGDIPQPPAKSSPPPPAPSTPPAPAATATPASSPGAPFNIQLDQLTISDVKLALTDRAVKPTNTIAINIDQVNATNIANGGPADNTSTLSAALSAPGLFKALSAEATATPFTPHPGGKFTCTINGIHPEILNPYLEPLGIHTALESATFTIDGSAAITAKSGESARIAVSLNNATLTDNGADLLTMSSIALSGLALGRDGSIEIASIDAKGPVFNVSRAADGTVSIPGFNIDARTKPATPAPATLAANAKPKPAAATVSLPPIKLDTFTWTGTRIRFDDKAVSGATPIEVTDAGLDIRELVIDPRLGASPKPGTLKAWLKSPGLAEDITFAGTLNPGSGGLATKLSGKGAGLDLTRFSPYLKPLGIEPTLAQGGFTIALDSRVQSSPDAITASLEITDAALLDGESRLGTASGIKIGSVALSDTGIAIGKIEVGGASTSARRTADGSIEVLGLRLLRTPPKPKSDEPLPDPFQLLAAAGNVSLEGIDVRNVKIAWFDEAMRSPIKTDISLAATLGALALNKPNATAAPFQVDLAASGVSDQIQLKGRLTIAPDALSLNATATGASIDSPILSAYLPVGAEARFKNGAFTAALKAGISKAQPDGIAARLDVSNVDWSEGGASLFHLGQFTVDIARIDLVKLDTTIRTIESSGITGSIGRNADGTLDAFGIALGVPQPKSAPPPATAPPQPAAAADVRTIIAGSQAPPPLISIERLDLRLDRLTFTDRARPDAAPVSINGARASAKAPFKLLGPKPEENPPVQLAVETAIDPIISRIGVDLKTAPFAQQPSLNLQLAITGIDGDGLVRILPELKDYIGTADLKGATITTSLDAEATVRRRGPTQIDLSRGLDLSFTVNETKFSRADGTVLGGVQKIRGEGFKVDTATGGVAAKSLEVTGLSGLAWRDEQGVHALGALIKLPEANASNQPEIKPSKPAQAAAPSPAPAPTNQPAESAAPTSPEFRIDRLTISGLDFRIEDRVVQPPVTIPINALDADIRGLSSRVLSQDMPVKFNISAGAGKVKLPKTVRGGILTGALSDLANLGKSESDKPVELEDREFFSQCIASGNLSLYPSPHGRANVSLSGLELPAIRGLAAAAGASVAGGVFDARADARTADNGNLELRSRLVLTDLKYKEPPNGPIVRYLHLSMPLDTAISAVEAPDGSITLPVNVTLTNKGLSSGEIVSAAAGAIADVLVTAVASAPVNIVTGFAGLFGDTKGDTTWTEEPPIYLSYTPGVSILDTESQTKLEEVLDRARSDKKVQVAISHELGSTDAALCASRTNPTADIARGLAESLRQRRVELLSRRIALLPAAQTESIRNDEEPQSLSELRDVQVQLAGVDDAMDRLYDLLRPGADRTAGRRTRAACLELADWRLNSVRRALSTIGGPAGTSRTAIAVPRADAADAEQSRLVIQVRRRGR